MTVLSDCKTKEVEDCYNQIREDLKNGETKTFYIHVIAGRSVLKDNRRSLIFNEYETREKVSLSKAKHYPDFHHYYKTYDIELEICDLAIKFPNSYHMVLYMTYDVPEKPSFNFYTFQQASDIVKETIINQVDKNELRLPSDMRSKSPHT